LAALLLIFLACPPTALGAAGSRHGSALLLFVNASEEELQGVPGLSLGILSASQGTYSPEQLALDIGQGARVGTSVYPHALPPSVSLRDGSISGWPAIRSRASNVPQILTPGLLASEVPGGAAYVSTTPTVDAVVAADRSGLVAAVSLGSASSLTQRVEGQLARKQLVVADLPDVADLKLLASRRVPGELLLVVQRLPTGKQGQLLWAGAAGLQSSEIGGTAPARELTSETTGERGLVGSMDLAPTILRHLGIGSLPEDVRGKPLEAKGGLDGAGLRSLMARLRVVGPRRIKALAFLLLGWLALLLALSRTPDGRARAVRIGAIGVLWAPVAVMMTAPIGPGAGVEYALIAVLCMALGTLGELFVPWPLAPVAPTVASLVLITADALAHKQVLVRSLLGPDPILGARFYGIGNELKSALAVMVLGTMAALMYRSERSRRTAGAIAAAGIVLAVIEGSARIGAGVGGVILVSAGFAVATILMLPGSLTRRRGLTVLLSPIIGLVALAAIDLATAHGGGHYTGSVLDALRSGSTGELKDVLVRRYKAAWGELHNHGMPVATVLALAGGAWAVKRRERLLAPVAGDPGWLAALAGGFTASVVGALVEDSGPVLLVVGVFALGCLCAYLWAPKRLTQPPGSPRTRRAARSRARRHPAAPLR
jgi:hypothetical protein